jgi:hypothetical protein
LPIDSLFVIIVGVCKIALLCFFFFFFQNSNLCLLISVLELFSHRM